MSKKRESKGKPEQGYDSGSNSGKTPGNKRPFNFYWIYGIIGAILIGINLLNFSNLPKTNWGDFVNMMKQDDIAKIVVVKNDEKVEIYIKKDRLGSGMHEKLKENNFSNLGKSGPHYQLDIGSVDQFNDDLKELQSSKPVESRIKPSYDNSRDWGGEIFSWLLPIIIMVGIWVFIMRRMTGGGAAGSQIFNIGKSKATLFDKERSVNVTFEDVAGLEEAKVEIQEIVDFLKNPKQYTDLGAKIPKGAMLVGPPGTGKTLLAKAVAGEAQVPFFSLSGSDFVEMFVGVGASRVRDLFKQAKEKAPAIIFIDEIDAIGRARGRGVAQGANDERENTLNQLLTEMDGFGTNSGVIILAATNRADVLDRALIRAGRFDRQIHVDLPDLIERKDIFKVHLKPLKIDKTVDDDFLARQTPGFSGADIANVCNEAALIAARKKRKKVTHQDFLDAVDRIIGGLEKKNKLITPEEKKVIAFHEAGHASVSWLVKYANPLVKVTIVPRGRSLGAAWYLPEERQLSNTEQLIDEMCAALGGRAAEELMFGKVSTGALSDLEKVTKQAYAMVSIYGLNNKIGHISFYDSTGQSDYSFSKPYSDKTAETIDEEVRKMVDQAYDRTKKILSDHKDQLTRLAELLLEKEVIFKDDLEEIFGKRPYESEHSEEKAAQASKDARASELKIDGGSNSQNGQEQKDSDGGQAQETAKEDLDQK